jgi:hypothetical protein
MEKILYIGGLASNPYQVNIVSRELSDHYGLNVIAMSFSEAQKDKPLVARLATSSLVVTHSAGMMMLKNITPRELIAIAPPMPVGAFLFTVRSIPKTVSFIKSHKNTPEIRQKMQKYGIAALKEHIIRPRYNAGQIIRVGAFDAAKEAVIMASNGTKVTLCFMEKEHIFLNCAQHQHVAAAKGQGVIVHDNVPGHHGDFPLYPLRILGQINRL